MTKHIIHKHKAMHLGLGGNPFGPAGTGKTECVKALGAMLGRLVLVFNCNEVSGKLCFVAFVFWEYFLIIILFTFMYMHNGFISFQLKIISCGEKIVGGKGIKTKGEFVSNFNILNVEVILFGSKFVFI